MASPRIAYLTGEYPRTSDTFIQREVAALRSAGTEVETFAVRRPGSEHLTGQEQRDGQATTTYLLEVAKGPALLTAQLSQLARRPGRFFSGLALAWRTKRPGLRGGIFQLVYFVEAVVLAQQMIKRNVEHLHNHFADSSCTVAMLASELSGVPYSFTLHGSAIFFEAHTWQLGTKVERASFCVGISHFTRSQAAIFADADALDRVHIVHCGVEPDRLSPVSHHGPGTSMLFVGRVVEAKGLAVLFEAMQGLTATRPDLTLTIVGDGPDRAGLERKASTMGLAEHVTFVGSKSQTEVAELLSAAEVFVLPSYAEGVPVVVMEALGTGVPVVASFVGGMAEIVENGVNGFLVPPGDSIQLSDRIGQLLDDAELRASMGAAGRAKVVKEFDSSVAASRLRTLIVNYGSGLPLGVRPKPQVELERGSAALPASSVHDDRREDHP